MDLREEYYHRHTQASFDHGGKLKLKWLELGTRMREAREIRCVEVWNSTLNSVCRKNRIPVKPVYAFELDGCEER